MFDALVDELRTHSTEWLHRERDELVAQRSRRCRPGLQLAAANRGPPARAA